MFKGGAVSPDAYLLLILVVALLTRLLFTRFRRRTSLNIINGNNQPLLNSYYTKDRELVPLDKGSFGQLKYVLYMTGFTTHKSFARNGREVVSTTADEEVIICCVDLPFISSAHLIGLAKNGSSTTLLRDFLEQRNLEKVNLEGDFPSYAHIYTPPGNQVNARYLLDPAAMVFVADFCKTHHWEIVGKYLYFVSSDKIQGRIVDKDPTPIMTEDVERFVAEIKPALGSE